MTQTILFIVSLDNPTLFKLKHLYFKGSSSFSFALYWRIPSFNQNTNRTKDSADLIGNFNGC